MSAERDRAAAHIADLMEEARLNAEHWGVEFLAVWGDPAEEDQASYVCSASEEFLDSLATVVGRLLTDIKSKKLHL